MNPLHHFYDGHDGFVYYVSAIRPNDGPEIVEIHGRAKTRTISSRAIGRTFHHHPRCPCNLRVANPLTKP